MTKCLNSPAFAQEEPKGAPSPGEIVAQAPASEWIAIPPEDLLVMTLAPDREGKERKVVIQLMPAPFSQGWVENIRALARGHWYDGIAVTRVQDNYVVQWGDPNGEDAAKAKPLPERLRVMDEDQYTAHELFTRETAAAQGMAWQTMAMLAMRNGMVAAGIEIAAVAEDYSDSASPPPDSELNFKDRYAEESMHVMGWPIASTGGQFWPVHCYGMVGVGRSMSPDTGTGAELYTVIGHAPRHLDRNIALVGRVVEGIEHLSSLPRGTGDLGFYETAEERTPIVSIRVVADLPAADQPKFQYLSTEGETFARYAEARANRRDPFFNVPAGGADICNIPVPVRPVVR